MYTLAAAYVKLSDRFKTGINDPLVDKVCLTLRNCMIKSQNTREMEKCALKADQKGVEILYSSGEPDME